MPQNQIEILIAAKDQASQQIQQLNQQLAQVDKAAKGAGQGLASAGAQSLSATKQFSALSSSTRFAAASVLTELNPALGLAVTRMSSLSTVAGTTGSLLKGTLVVGGIALVATALGSWIRRTNEQIEAQQKLNRQVASFDVAGIQGSVAALSAEIDLAIAKQQTFFGIVLPFWEEVAKSILGTSTSLDLLKQRLKAAGEAFEKVRPKQFQAELAAEQAQREKLIQTIDQQTVTTSENIEEIRRAGSALEESSDREAKFQARRLEITAKGAIEKARAEGLGQAEIERLELFHAQQRENLIIQFTNRKLEIVRQTNERVKALVDQAEKEAEAKAEDVARRAGERIDKIFDAIKKQQEQVERIMTSLGNAAADALFDGLIGRSRSLGEAFKSFFEGLARDIFRNTLTTLIGGKTQGISLQNLLSLGGGGGPFGSRVAAVAAGVPGVGGTPSPQTAGQVAAGFGFGTPIPSPFLPTAFAPGTAAELEARGLGGLLADGGGAAGGLTFAQGLGAGLFVLGGALAIFSTSQMTSPALGAITGGLGGLSAAFGLSTLLGLGLGPLGLGIGFAFGAVAGFMLSSSAKRRAERQLAFRQAVIDTVNRIEREAERFSPEQIDELIDFLQNGVAPSNAAVVGLANAVRNLTGLQGPPPGGVLPPGLVPIGVPTDVLAGQRFRGLIGAEAFDSLLETLRQLRTRAESAGGFLIEEALAPGIMRLEALATLGPRQRAQAISALQRGALVSLINAAGPEEMELIIARIRETSELMGLPVLGQARYVEILG